MASTLKNKRMVRVQLSFAELSALIVGPATDAGFIDFVPDHIEIFDDGTGTSTFEVTFEVDL